MGEIIQGLLRKNNKLWIFNNRRVALTGVAQWVGHPPRQRRVASLIPHQGTRLGCRFSP